ncbi:MAG TPA: xanthine dehydrogenase family protein subunit M [Candidatus Polarisedimenticolaceae bacterium]|nr:xanthine dehydrogenase family protein subunit M [Candidatus Polarisedimenticolaceae bacterium]
MMRLPGFRYRSPRSVEEAVRILAGEGPQASVIAGGTDLLPNMKRRHQLPRTLVSLSRIDELRARRNGDGLVLGAGLTLTDVVEDARVQRAYPALWQAAAQIATPHLRNMGTLGGNLCLDTRCTYYNQNHEWRAAISYCMKCEGQTCWVAPASKRCLAVSSTDTAPALVALDARVTLRSVDGERELAASELFHNDGIDYLNRRPGEILTAVRLGSRPNRRSAYWKLRRRGSFDFPVLSVAAAATLDGDGTVADARIVLGAVASRPLFAERASEELVGRPLDDDAIATAAAEAAKSAKPMDNTDFSLHWRKRVAAAFVGYALRELRGDDMRGPRRTLTRWNPGAIASNLHPDGST